MTDYDKAALQSIIRERHYTHSVTAGKSHYFLHNEVVVVFSIPANKNVSTWLLGKPNKIWELSRLWAEDGHEPNALTKALRSAIQEFRIIEPACEALISYADPNAGHEGGVYRAASWTYLGQVEETRAYRSPTGQIVSRRKFHTGSRGLRKAEIEALGYTEHKLPGKWRFAKGLTRLARRSIKRKLEGMSSA